MKMQGTSSQNTPSHIAPRFRASALLVGIFLGVLVQAARISAADLAVEFYPPSLDVMTNDWAPYSIKVTNLGPDNHPGESPIFQFPNALLVDVSPTNTSYSYVDNWHYIQINTGALTNGESRNYSVRVRSTNSVPVTFLASFLNPQEQNDSATLDVSPGLMLPSQLIARTNSTMVFNPMNSLMEQSILLSNAGPTSVASARVVISGLGTNWMYNAAGTNSGNPFIVYGGPLAPGQTVNLLGQYVNPPRTAFPIADSQFQAYAVPLASFSATAIQGLGTPITFYKMDRLPNGNTFLEFKTTPGRSYTVLYSDNPEFANPMVAPPSLLAGATAKQWIDYGPPATISSPTPSTPRFYRVYLNP